MAYCDCPVSGIFTAKEMQPATERVMSWIKRIGALRRQ